nr:hypothetical protein [uncultured Caldimonas sp.]
MSFITSQYPLEIHHVQAIVRAMHELSLTDGQHDAERVMLRGFYDSCQGETGALTTFEELIRVPLDLSTLAETFPSADLKAAFLQSCVLLGYADGKYSQGEQAKVKAYAQALGADDALLKEVEDAIADHLMQQISRIENLDALREVSKEMRRS